MSRRVERDRISRGRRAAALLAAAALASCAEAVRQPGAPPSGPDGAAVPHAVESEQLAQTMRQLAWLAVARLPQELGTASLRGEQAEAVARLCFAIAEAAEAIPGGIEGQALGEPERQEFGRLARALADRSRELGRQAPRLRLPQLRAGLDGIEASCEDCHRRYRALREASGA